MKTSSRKMGCMIGFLFLSALSPSMGGETVREAFSTFMGESYFRRRNAQSRVMNYGMPPVLKSSASFGRLVAALSNECGGCFATWTAVGTNDFTREVFRIALAESGPTVYTPFLTNLLLAVERNPTAGGVTEVEYSLGAACTKLENYYMLNYAQPVVGACGCGRGSSSRRTAVRTASNGRTRFSRAGGGASTTSLTASTTGRGGPIRTEPGDGRHSPPKIP